MNVVVSWVEQVFKMPSTKLWLLVSSRPSLTTLSTFLALLSLLRLCWEVQCHGEGETLSSAFGHFDLSELEELQFEVGIGEQPVSERILSSDRDAKTVIISSKYGQRYSCVLPTVSASTREAALNKLGDELLNVSKLLEPLRGECFYKNDGWWTYKYCHGNQVTQFHLEAGETSGDIIQLGYFETEQLWQEEELLRLMYYHSSLNTSPQRRQSTQGLYAKTLDYTSIRLSSHDLHYVNGTFCALNGKRRHTRVKFICHIQPGDTKILNVIEHRTCNYTLIIHTPLLCSHPAFKPPMLNGASSITCSPVVSEKKYEQFLKEAEEKAMALSSKQKEVHEEQDEKEGESVSVKSHSNAVPLAVVLNSLASSVVQKLQEKKTVAKSRKKSSSGEERSKEEEEDGEEGDVFDDEEVDAMVDEMVAKTLENLVGMKMPSPHPTQDSHQGDSEQQPSSAPAQRGEESGGDDESAREVTTASSHEQNVGKGEGEAGRSKGLQAGKLKVEFIELKAKKQTNPEKEEEEEESGDDQPREGSSKVVEVHAETQTEAVSMLAGILHELLQLQADTQGSKSVQQQQKHEALEQSYASTWEDKKERDEVEEEKEEANEQ